MHFFVAVLSRKKKVLDNDSLAGGFNPEKYARQIGSFPKEVKIKNI